MGYSLAYTGAPFLVYTLAGLAALGVGIAAKVSSRRKR